MTMHIIVVFQEKPTFEELEKMQVRTGGGVFSPYTVPYEVHMILHLLLDSEGPSTSYAYKVTNWKSSIFLHMDKPAPYAIYFEKKANLQRIERLGNIYDSLRTIEGNSFVASYMLEHYHEYLKQYGKSPIDLCLVEILKMVSSSVSAEIEVLKQDARNYIKSITPKK